MPYSVLAILYVGGWVVAAIDLYCAQFNANLVLRWKALFEGADRRCEEALRTAQDALSAAEVARAVVTESFGEPGKDDTGAIGPLPGLEGVS